MGGEEAIARWESVRFYSRWMFHSRLEGGCAADEGRSPSSLERLLLLALEAVPLFADDMFDRSGELEIVRLGGKEGQRGAVVNNSTRKG
jgi:hypothetical protein